MSTLLFVSSGVIKDLKRKGSTWCYWRKEAVVFSRRRRSGRNQGRQEREKFEAPCGLAAIARLKIWFFVLAFAITTRDGGASNGNRTILSHQAWLCVLMGRRPPSVRWSAAHGRNASAARARVQGRSWHWRPSKAQSAKVHPRSSPEIQGIKTRNSHRRIENDGTEKQLLQEALKGVKKAAQDVRGKFLLEFQEGQTRWSKLRAEVAKVLPAQVCSPPDLVGRWPDCSRWRTLSQQSAVLWTGCQDPGHAQVPVPRNGRVACDAIQSSGSREVVVGSTCGFAGRFGVCRLWLCRQVDSIVELHAMSEVGDEDMLLRSAPGEGRFSPY